jgi:glutamyl-tRNA synthetase
MVDPLLPARVRFAPSPTGRFHIGGARTALYDFLLARKTAGQFILRIEDTDRRRLVEGAEQEIMDSLRWLGLAWDEGPDVGGPVGPYRQSERGMIYQEHAQELIERGWAYPCFCTPQRLSEVRQLQQKRKQPPRYDGRCRGLPMEEAAARQRGGEPSVVRFKTPTKGSTTATDLLRGPITVENASLDDFILLKSDGLPVYHLAAMVDDRLMRITHVLRSSEWLPTFPLHVLIYRALGWEEPIWVHLSVFLSPTGKGKMSKRDMVDPKEGVKSIYTLDLRKLGYLPEAVVNWMALMGWSYDDRTELFSLAELTEKFSLERLNPSPAAVNFGKLDHFNGVYIRGLHTQDLSARLLPFFEAAGLEADSGLVSRITPLIQERIRTLDEAPEIAGFFFRPSVSPAPQDLVAEGLGAQQSAEAAKRALAILADAPSLVREELEPAMRKAAEGLGLTAGQFFGILRVAITGQRVSPPLLETMEILGRDAVVARVRQAISILQSLPA